MEIQGVLAAGTRVEGLQVTSRSAGPPFYQMSHTELFISHKICFFFGNILRSLNLQITNSLMITMPIRYFVIYVQLSFGEKLFVNVSVGIFMGCNMWKCRRHICGIRGFEPKWRWLWTLSLQFAFMSTTNQLERNLKKSGRNQTRTQVLELGPRD